MQTETLSFSSFNESTSKSGAPKRDLRISIVRNMEDMMRVATIRAAVYMAEQNCPYEEEFDGNDFCSTHMLGYVDGEPVGCLRIRFFGGFAKLERVAVRSAFRNTRISFVLIRAAIDHCHRKGFEKIIGHARNELIPLWQRFGFRVTETSRELVFSDFKYTEMVLAAPLPENSITIRTDPYELIRPEGQWDEPGVLEDSVERSITTNPNISIAAE